MIELHKFMIWNLSKFTMVNKCGVGGLGCVVEQFLIIHFEREAFIDIFIKWTYLKYMRPSLLILFCFFSYINLFLSANQGVGFSGQDLTWAESHAEVVGVVGGTQLCKSHCTPLMYKYSPCKTSLEFIKEEENKQHPCSSVFLSFFWVVCYQIRSTPLQRHLVPDTSLPQTVINCQGRPEERSRVSVRTVN